MDIGCGTAYKLMNLVFPICQNVTGIDSQPAVELCKTRYSAGAFYTEDLEAPTLKLKGGYDMVICSDVIEHLIDPNVLVDYIKALCHENTLIVISTPERDYLRDPNCMACRKPGHIREWNEEELTRYLQSRGLKIIKSILYPPMRFNWSKEYFSFLKRVIRAEHAFNTCQTLVTKTSGN